eukprot:2438219-Pleurochrysis_carterae.AAC.1
MPDVFCSGCGTLLSGLEQVIVHVHMAAASSAFVWSIPSDITYGVICPILKQDHDNAFAALLSSPMKYPVNIEQTIASLDPPGIPYHAKAHKTCGSWRLAYVHPSSSA